MEESHRTHKDIPFGYWTQWVRPAFRFLTRRWNEPKDNGVADCGLDQFSAPH